MNISGLAERQSDQPDLTLFNVFSIGATGAPTLAAGGRGITGSSALARQSAGSYILTLKEPVNAFLDWNIQTKSAGITLTTAFRAVVTAYNAAAGTIAFTMVNSNTGVATEIVNGDTLHVTVVVRNSNSMPL
jgi:hypothetical protein